MSAGLLRDRVAIIIGASRGIGRNIAVELAAEGCNVVIAARSEAESDPRLPETIHSVADGKVVSTLDGRPEVPPFIVDNPTLTAPSDFCGNGVVVKVARGQYAHYCHLQPGSVRVEAGDRVRTGAKLGLFGNSGNTDGPHLHFGIQDGPDALTSTSLPFEIDRFRLEGMAAAGQTPGETPVTGEPREERRSHPLVTSVSGYSR
jgi:hypothetical protein